MADVTTGGVLSDTALVLLGRAAASENQMLLPIPKSVRAHGKALERILQSLLSQGLVEEIPVGLAEEAWRSDREGRHGLACRAWRVCAFGYELIGGGWPVGDLEVEVLYGPW